MKRQFIFWLVLLTLVNAETNIFTGYRLHSGFWAMLTSWLLLEILTVSVLVLVFTIRRIRK